MHGNCHKHIYLYLVNTKELGDDGWFVLLINYFRCKALAYVNVDVRSQVRTVDNCSSFLIFDFPSFFVVEQVKPTTPPGERKGKRFVNWCAYYY